VRHLTALSSHMAGNTAATWCTGGADPAGAAAAPRVATFCVDATPPLGTPLMNGGSVDHASEVVTPLTARGLVLSGLPGGGPVVLCAVDWTGIANESHDRFRAALAKGACTTIARVALHTLHQHDAPGTGSASDSLLAKYGFAGRVSNPALDDAVVSRLESAARTAVSAGTVVAEVSAGAGRVQRVASNRRILGPDGRVILQRQSAGAKNPAAAAAPEGTIDPWLRVLVLYACNSARLPPPPAPFRFPHTCSPPPPCN
jgi:hypothetical protein